MNKKQNIYWLTQLLLLFEQVYTLRMYRVHGSGTSSIHLEPVALCSESLDPRYVFLLDTGLKIYLWYGKRAKNTFKSKARLVCFIYLL